MVFRQCGYRCRRIAVLSMVKDDAYFMRRALAEAQKAYDKGEVPVGCVIVQDGKILARGHNLREEKQNALLHAEAAAIQKASRKLKSWRLCGCTLYVTLEPCPMCAGAIINARVDRVVYGAPDPKAGCAGSVTDLFALPFNHRPQITAGVLSEECGEILRRFFKALRKRPRT